MIVSSGGRLSGELNISDMYAVSAMEGAVIDFAIAELSPEMRARVVGLSSIRGAPIYTLTISDSQVDGVYLLAEKAADFNSIITVQNMSNDFLGTLSLSQSSFIGGVNYSLNLDEDSVLSVTVESAVSVATKSDVDGNGISDVMFVWTGEHGEGNYQHGYWMNGTSEWRSANSGHPAEWENLGCYDMSGDGKADSVLVGNVVVNGVKGAYIGYYADADDQPDGSTWVNIGYLHNANDLTWKNKVGNLTGKGKNSIVWYTHHLGALGAWIDGAETWVSIAGGFDANWSLIGCGDFDGNVKDEVVMAYNGGAKYYAYAIDGTCTELGDSDSGWEVRAIGDFAGDGKDDIVAFHSETGLIAMWGDGDCQNKWSLIGQLDVNDWFVVGAGDYDGDRKDDLLVRQISTGMLGYYSNGDMAQWNTLGYGVDMDWTVIA